MQIGFRRLLPVVVAMVVIAAAVIFLNGSPAVPPDTQSTSPNEDLKAPAGSVASDTYAHPVSKTRNLPKVTIEVPPPADQDAFLSALHSILPDTNTHRKRKALMDLMEYLTPEMAPSVRDELLKLSKAGYGSEFGWWAFCTRWGEIDPKGALEYFSAHPDDPGAKDAISHVMEGWVGVDGRSARSWLAANHESPFFREALWSYVQNLARSDIAQATNDLFAVGPDKDALWNTMGALVKTARDRGQMEGVVNWFDSLSETQKPAAFEHAMWAIKDADLQTAVDWFTANADKPWRNDYHFSHIAKRYAQENPQAALDWVLSLPDDPGRPGIPAGMSTIMETWGGNDPQAAATWLNQHQDAQWLPRATMGYIRGLQRADPNAANTFIGQLSPEAREAVRREMDGH